MGSKKMRIVRCPHDGRVQPTDGSIYFVCEDCRKAYSIDPNLYKKEDKNDIRFSDKIPDRNADRDNIEEGNINSQIPSTDRTEKRKEITFTGGTSMIEPDEDDTYNCADCNAPMEKGQKFCPSCGKEMNWEGIT